jgi:hypothetical protein
MRDPKLRSTMFAKFKKPPTALDLEIERMFRKLKTEDPTTEEYEALLDRTSRLHKMQTEAQSNQVSRDPAVLAATNLAGVLLVINYERLHVVSKSAMALVKRI